MYDETREVQLDGNFILIEDADDDRQPNNELSPSSTTSSSSSCCKQFGFAVRDDVTNAYEFFSAFTMRMLTKKLASKNTIVSQFAYVSLFVIFGSFFLLAPIFLITIGLNNISKCSIKPMIPVWLVVLGFMVLLNLVAGCLFSESNMNLIDFQRGIDLVILAFLFIWLILGTYWVSSVNYVVNEVLEKDCDRLCYRTAVVTLFALWTLLAVANLSFVCYLVYKAIRTAMMMHI